MGKYYVVSLLMVVLIGCSAPGPDDISGGVKTGNGVYGECGYKNGDPACNAMVILRPDNYFTEQNLLKRAMVNIDTALTDENGRFDFDSIASGEYVIEFNDLQGNGTSVWLETTTNAEKQDLGRKILKPYGSIAGTISMEKGEEPEKIDVVLLGLARQSFVDTAGNFQFDSLPQGNYIMRFRPTQDYYSVTDTLIVVLSGRESRVEYTPRYSKAPPISSVSISYDSLRQIVNLLWQEPGSGPIVGYNVYRFMKGYNIPTTPINEKLISLTKPQFSDSSVQEGIPYEYRIVSVDTARNESPKIDGDNDTITTRSVLTLIDSAIIGAGFDVWCPLDSGRIAMAERFGNRIHIIDYTGRELHEFGDTGDSASLLNGVVDIASDGIRRLCIYDTTGYVKEYSFTGTYIRRFLVTKDTAARITCTEERLFAVDSGRVWSIDANKTVQDSFFLKDPSYGKLADIAFKPTNKLFVVLTGGTYGNKIYTMDFNGTFTNRWSVFGVVPGQLQSTAPLRLDATPAYSVCALTRTDIRVISISQTFSARFRLHDIAAWRSTAPTQELFSPFDPGATTAITDVRLSRQGQMIVSVRYDDTSRELRIYNNKKW